MLFVGVSMGGFAALSFSHLADSVLTFSPQVDLTFSHLRPSKSMEMLQKATDRQKSNIVTAVGKGKRIEVHCGIDEHLLHAKRLPQGVKICVHPLWPRSGLGHALDGLKALSPIVLHKIQQCSQSQETNESGLFLAYHELNKGQTQRISLLKASIQDAHGLCVEPRPRPGEWICRPFYTQCYTLNKRDDVYCKRCKSPRNANSLALGSGPIFTPSDWKCLACKRINFSSHTSCKFCGNMK